MDRKTLERNYNNLIGIKILESEIRDMLETDDGFCADTILDYSTGQAHAQGISGFDVPRFRRKLRKFAVKKEEVKAVEAFIQAIPDERTRKVFELRLKRNEKWKTIAKKIGVPHNEDYPRKCIYDAYLKKVGIK